MNLACGYRPNSNQDSVLIIKLSCSRILTVISKSLFLAIFILALPSIDSYENHANRKEFVPMVFKDLAAEGLFKDGQKGLVLSSGIGDLFDGFWFLEGIDVVTDLDLDLDGQMVVDDEPVGVKDV
ncbi:hypothetical protein L1987_55118 [Smallanthus sonchifolius]|uniref:Uncharacterized protein n=1 Tax=Smallanthus sonchifolius TaxID=185202 RepID=A0ACB9EA40_9ASTR|nr:hypothetical protein L1987_55118 [Smallanthus sonchifolius]